MKKPKKTPKIVELKIPEVPLWRYHTNNGTIAVYIPASEAGAIMADRALFMLADAVKYLLECRED